MKERIEELAKQCGWDMVSSDCRQVSGIFDLDKFAKIIHNEALEMAANEFGDGKTDTWPSVSIADEIRKLKV